jgi:hypothetical protein
MLARRPSLASYALRNLVSTLETKEAMQYSHRHYSSLVGLAQLFKDADSRGSGVLTLEDMQSLFRDDQNQRLPEALFRIMDRVRVSLVLRTRRCPCRRPPPLARWAAGR